MTAVLMGILIWVCADALILTHKEGNRQGMMLYIMILIFCFAEYGAWTASCFWMGDTFANPYFYIELLVSALFLIMPYALKKAVRNE